MSTPREELIAFCKAQIADCVRQDAAYDQEKAAARDDGTAPACAMCKAPLACHPWQDFCQGCGQHVCSECEEVHYPLGECLIGVANLKIRAGDTVRHLPSGETWVVACVDFNGYWRLYWCGWPPGSVHLYEVRPERAGTDAEHREMLEEWARKSTAVYTGRYGHDPRPQICAEQLFLLNRGHEGAGI